jgi:hypothetical protein
MVFALLLTNFGKLISAFFLILSTFGVVALWDDLQNFAETKNIIILLVISTTKERVVPIKLNTS